jgi:predicted dienelactone hydrolase
VNRIAALAILLTAGSLYQPPPAAVPTGPLGFGRTHYTWTDRVRNREIPAHAWYPMPLTSRAWPVVVYSHGAGTPVATYTAKLDDLASHGYIVVAPQYPADPLDPGRCRAAAGTAYDEMVEIGLRCVRDRAAIVAADIGFVLDRIADVNRARGGSPDLGGRFDLTHLAAVGHSLGGFASVRACQLDTRISACVNEDGGTADGAFLQYAGDSGPKQPLLYVEASLPALSDQQLAATGLTRADWNARLDRMVTVVHERQLHSSGPGSYKVALHAPGMQHGSFGDLYLTATTDDARRTALHNLEICEAVTLAFLDKVLKGAKGTLLDDDSRRPEIVVQRY